MTDLCGELRVTLAADGFYPRSFWWRGRTVRVLAVERVGMHGNERRLRVRTPIGPFELSLVTASDRWRVRRAPGWLARLFMRLKRMPRYPLPPWRRRAFAAAPARPVAKFPEEVPSHAGRFALVRQ
ncbi:MAG: hypothetical protein ACP5UQ_17230 [Anaerolineae bacterium]